MNIDLKFYWKLLLRRLPAMTALFLVFALIGVALAMKLPTTYQSSARLLVEGAQIRDVSAVTQMSANQTLQIIRQKLIARANLIDIANERKVFPEIKTMTPDEVVDAMREAVSVRFSSPKSAATFLDISFVASDPRVAAAVVNDMVTLVLSENNRIRTGRAVDALDFFEQEVDRLEAQLSQGNERLLKFQREHAGALPSSLDYRMNRQDQIQARIARIERDIEGLKEQRERVVNVFDATGRVQAPQKQNLSPEERQLENLKAELNSALTVYSESHPRIRVLKTKIAGVESAIAAQGGATSSGDEENQQSALYELTLTQIDSQIESLNQEKADAEIELEKLQKSIEQTAPNQIALASLEREVANIQSQYNAAVQRSNVAAMGERIELSSRGQRISVVENAVVPSKPFSPNRPMIMAGGMGAGLAAAAFLFLLLEVLNRSVRRPAEVTSKLGITPIGAIPYMETKTHKWVRRSARIAAMLIVVTGIPAALWAIDTFYLPLDLVVERVINKVGLG